MPKKIIKPTGTWGGARPGSGPDRTGRHTRSVYVTDEEFRETQAFVEKLKKRVKK